MVAGPGFGPIFGPLARNGIVFGIGGFEPPQHLCRTGQRLIEDGVENQRCWIEDVLLGQTD